MWKRQFALAALALLLHAPVAAAGRADRAPLDGNAVQAVTAPPAALAAGTLYRISRGGQLSYLFGTVHVGSQAMYPLAPEVSRALGAATKLVVELDTRAEAAFQPALARHGSYPAGDDIRRHIGPATLSALIGALNKAGLHLERVAHLRPWLLANLLMGLELERHGFEMRHGLESFLLADAQRRGTSVTELESADYQLSLFNTLDEGAAERYLQECLRDMGDGTALRKSKAMINAWSSGRPDQLDAVIADATEGGSVVSVFIRDTLLERRNPAMADRIETIMQDNKVTFVGIGMLHLLGSNGLPRLLSQRGFLVERVR